MDLQALVSLTIGSLIGSSIGAILFFIIDAIFNIKGIDS